MPASYASLRGDLSKKLMLSAAAFQVSSILKAGGRQFKAGGAEREYKDLKALARHRSE
jgi:hypothetical protein